MIVSGALVRHIPPARSRAHRIHLSSHALAVLALIGANVIWGASAVASMAVLSRMPPATAACLRVGIALAVLLPLVTRRGVRPTRDRATALLGLTGVAFFCLFQNVGLLSASAATAALINGGIPVLTALLAALFIGEQLGGRQLAGLLISFTGVLSIVLLGGDATSGGSALGSMLVLASAVSFAAFTVLGRRTFAAGNALAIVAGSTRYGFVFLLPAAGLELATAGPASMTASTLLLLLFLGAGCSALAFVLCGYGLARLDAGKGAVFGNLKPIVGILLAVILVGESLVTGQVAGGALVLLGVILTRSQNQRPTR